MVKEFNYLKFHLLTTFFKLFVVQDSQDHKVANSHLLIEEVAHFRINLKENVKKNKKKNKKKFKKYLNLKKKLKFKKKLNKSLLKINQFKKLKLLNQESQSNKRSQLNNQNQLKF